MCIRDSAYLDRIRSGESTLDNYLPFWAAALIDRYLLFVLPIALVLVPIVSRSPVLITIYNKRKITRWYSTVRSIDRRVMAMDVAEIDQALNDLELIEMCIRDRQLHRCRRRFVARPRLATRRESGARRRRAYAQAPYLPLPRRPPPRRLVEVEGRAVQHRRRPHLRPARQRPPRDVYKRQPVDMAHLRYHAASGRRSGPDGRCACGTWGQAVAPYLLYTLTACFLAVTSHS